MKKTLALVIVALVAGCTASSVGDESAAEQLDPGKADGYGYEIVYTSYTNKHRVDPGELVSLTLSEADPSELPAAHYEGRYELVEQTADGTRGSAGFFNSYRYADRLWIRFHDAETGENETSYEKYSWVYWDGTLVMSGVGSDSEFFMEPPLAGTVVDCTLTELFDDNIWEEGLSIEEYPDVSFEHDAATGEVTVDIGAAMYDGDDGESLAFAIEGGVAKATVTTRYGDSIVVTGPANGTGTGEIVVTEDGETSRVAALACTGETAGAAPTPVTYDCNNYGENPFGIGASDALRKTPAEALYELTADNASDVADSYELAQLDVVVAREEAADRASFFDRVDEGTVYVYEVSYNQVAYVWFQYFYHSTEAGFVFAYYSDEPEAQVGDGDIRGCRSGICDDYSVASPVGETTNGLTAEPRATRTASVTSSSDVSATTEAQLRTAVAVLYEEDASEMPFAEVIDYADEATMYIYDIDGGTWDWVMFWAGDTEVGVMFDAGTNVPVATVGDTDISGCAATN